MVILDFLQVDLHSGYNLFWGMTLDSSSKPLIELVLFIYVLCRFVMFFTLKNIVLGQNMSQKMQFLKYWHI